MKIANTVSLKSENRKPKNYEIDMCNGPLLSKIMLFYFPLMLSGILQLLFNAADMVVVGRFSGSDALAAVGSTASLINLLTNLFIGLSVGVNVMVSRFWGAGKKKELSDIVHTAILTALIGGICLIFIGYLLAAPILRRMGAPENVLDQAVLYLRIYFCGMPGVMIYNYGSAVLRAVGDTRRPLYFLTISGVVNVVLNLVFVILFSMGVAGVALATIISQTISMILIVRCLLRTDADYKLELKKLRIVPGRLLEIVRIGLPAGINGALFSISNVLIQSSVNSFGSIVMAGNAAAVNIEGFIYTALNSFYQAAISFTGQNYGAMKYKRIGKIAFICSGMVVVVGLLLGNAVYLFSDSLLRLYTTNPEVVKIGILRLGIIAVLYCLCGMQEIMVGIMRGMGYSVVPMLVSLTGACAFRVIWIFTIFRRIRTLECLYWSYPISWILTFVLHFCCFLYVYRKLLKKNA